jgi:hypothetical protein
MIKAIKAGDCVRLLDGRIGRVRNSQKNGYRVRVARKNSNSHQLLWLTEEEITKIQCPDGWMSPEGYNRYIRKTLAKMKQRMK